MKRINVETSATLKELYDVVYKAFNLMDYGFSLFADRGLSKEIRSSGSETINSKQLKHGDVVYYKQAAGASVSCDAIISLNLLINIEFIILDSIDV